MTRKQAIRLILQYLDEAPELNENLCKAKIKLQEMLCGIPGKIWDDAAIREAIDRFISENGRPPKVKELDTTEYLPPHTSVYQQYKMTAGAWLNENYPNSENHSTRVSCAGYSPSALRAVFVSEFERIQPASGTHYNRCRRSGTPSWQYIAKMLSVRTWTELKALCGCAPLHRRKGETEFSVSSSISGLDLLL